MTPLLKVLETRLIEVLQPLVGTDGDQVRQIQVFELEGAETLPDLVRKHKMRMPGGFLSVPNVAPEPRNARLLDLTVSYVFLVGFSDRRAHVLKQDLAYQFFDATMAALAFRQLSSDGTSAQLDYIRPGPWDFTESEGITAAMTNFSLGVRNWTIAQPNFTR